MKLDRDMMALMKATKKVARAPRQAVERARKSGEPHLSEQVAVETVRESETAH